MAIKIVTMDLNTVRTYTPKSEEHEEVKTTFKFKPMGKRQLALYKDNSSRMSLQTNSFYFGNSANAIEIFKAQIVDWENVLDEKDKPIAIKITNGLVSDEQINLFPLELIEEVSNHIITVSSMTKEIETL